MASIHAYRCPVGGMPGKPQGAAGFTLVELLTVIAIIALLIGILIPSLTVARNSAKKTSTAAAVKVIATGLEAFKNDHGKYFRQTNGYPPSFAHPPILDAGATPTFQPHLGEFPFLDISETDPPVVYGAHWLSAMLIGVDALGVVSRGAVPPGLRAEPWEWYADDPVLERSPLYVDPTGLKTVPTWDLLGDRNESSSVLFPDWGNMRNLPVIVDAFDQPILYYASNTYGTTANMLEDERNEGNSYCEGNVCSPPFYFHQDNEGFTGNDTELMGWDFGGGEHSIARSGADLNASNIDDDRETFARFILDTRAYAASWGDDGSPPSPTAPLQPCNSDTFLLITAGRDGRYGTVDDVTNFPIFAD